MDWDGAIERNAEALRRIVALLFALAALAERAAARPPAVRMLVHWLLRRAELAARSLFIEPAGIEARAARETPPGTGPRTGHRTEPCDLIRMAVSLRAIAMLLAAGCAAPSGGRQRAFPRLAVVRLRILDLSPARLNDTS